MHNRYELVNTIYAVRGQGRKIFKLLE